MKKILSRGYLLFHFGILDVIAGNVVGLVVPESWTNDLGIFERTYHLLVGVVGTAARVTTVTSLVLLIHRRRTLPSLFRVTSARDKIMYLLLGIVIALGLVNTIGVNLFGVGGNSSGYNYWNSVAV